MSGRGYYGDTTQRCAYCGKPEVSWLWSISSPFRNLHYCSLECSARDNQSVNLGCCLCILPLTIIVGTGFALDLISPNQISEGFLMLFGFVLLLQIITIYQVYVGRRPLSSEM